MTRRRRNRGAAAAVTQGMDHVSTRVRLLGASALLLLCTSCGVGSNAGGTSGASCATPYLNDQPSRGPSRGPRPTVRPGATITVYGHWYTLTCNDTGGQEKSRPLPPVHLTLTLPGGGVQDLGAGTPSGQDMGFSSRVHVPAATRAGIATVHDDREPPASYTFEVERRPAPKGAAAPRSGHGGSDRIPANG